MPPALFALVIFPTVSHVYALASLDLDPPIYASCLPGMTGMYHHSQFDQLRWEVSGTFCSGWTWTTIFSIFTFWVAGITGGSHHGQLNYFFFSGTGVWTQGLRLARQVLYHLIQSPGLLGHIYNCCFKVFIYSVQHLRIFRESFCCLIFCFIFIGFFSEYESYFIVSLSHTFCWVLDILDTI
jgi:hypothetical protein